MAGYFATPFDTPTPTEGSSTPWATWSAQMDPYDTRNQADLSKPNYTPAYNPQAQGQLGMTPALSWAAQPETWYGARMPSFGDVSYDPVWGRDSASYQTPAVQYGSLMNSMFDQYAAQHPSAWMSFSNNQGSGSNSGAVTSLGGDWAKVDTWTSQIQAAVQKVYHDTGVYVPPNFVKSVMKLESGGVPLGVNDSGAYGLMQVTGNTMGNYDMQKVATDNAYNIYAGVNELAIHYNQGDPSTGQKSWEWAAKRYLGLGGKDSLGTDANAYWQQVSNNWQQLQTGFDKTGQTGGNATTGTKQFSAIYGGIDAPITQGFGMTDFARQQIASGPNNEYAYTAAYSPDGQPMGHAGVDVGVNYHTRLYAPAAGQISIIGSTDGQHWYYTSQDDAGSDVYNPQGGELAIHMANGDDYILGHMSQIVKADGNPYKVGDYVKPGDFVGFSGQSNGAHVHIEYRHLTPGATSSGFTVVDPTKAFGGDFSGSYQGTGDLTATAPTDTANWQGYLRANIQGKPINLAAPPSVGGFHDWLYNQLKGNPTGEQQSSPMWMWAGGQTGADTSTQNKTG